ncbi:hypothetical protein HYH02_006664 [Chlamydomonas schloesseri]|uniref:Fatty acid desaturase domain-containing protein n=1 Tax=Chlamydomonas schloesseri TaxID=2026947 RepID=A0A835T2L1_9CHLO|nr:hypothetical protein HYH02_006664 [Chlamydomonas schloesseri]|eukprot:KAG2432679.1 hypothetical protein HYH02_006664 [Chlamydomonas schloesseri]
MAEDILKLWQRQYHLPREDSDQRTLRDRVHLYRPPRSDLAGIAVASAVIVAWATLFVYGLWFVKLPWALKVGETATSWPVIVSVFFSLEFLYTGLFITTHDAMHGTIALRNRRLNDFLGQLAISLYAWFDYSVLHRKHWEHHNHTGEPCVDPDFHRGNPNLLVWFTQFMVSYMTLPQFLKIAAWSNVLLLAGAPLANQLLFMTAAPILSAFRLFYYGTYVPHHPEKGHTGPMPWQVSRTSSASRLQSFLTCYHFDLHWEHHRWPYAPWWELPKCRAIARRADLAPAPLPVPLPAPASAPATAAAAAAPTAAPSNASSLTSASAPTGTDGPAPAAVPVCATSSSDGEAQPMVSSPSCSPSPSSASSPLSRAAMVGKGVKGLVESAKELVMPEGGTGVGGGAGSVVGGKGGGVRQRQLAPAGAATA